jgi:hypothetical protein
VWTLVEKDDPVAREAKDTWRVVFWSPKDFGAAEVARRSELHARNGTFIGERANDQTVYLYKMQSLPRQGVKII